MAWICIAVDAKRKGHICNFAPQICPFFHVRFLVEALSMMLEVVM